MVSLGISQRMHMPADLGVVLAIDTPAFNDQGEGDTIGRRVVKGLDE